MARPVSRPESYCLLLDARRGAADRVLISCLRRRDEDGVLHALSHAGGWDPSGGHAWSVDGGATWSRHDDVAAYGSLLLRTDDTSVSLSRRERPHLVFGGDGLPIALTNGVTEAWPCGHPEVCPQDHCYTALQALNQT